MAQIEGKMNLSNRRSKLALENGSALSRKVLVMFVVQRLEPHYPQASKTSIGHLVPLLYRASCFKVNSRISVRRWILTNIQFIRPNCFSVLGINTGGRFIPDATQGRVPNL